MKIITLILILGLLGCSEFSNEADFSETTRRLLSADPEKDFRYAISNNNYKFKGIYGFSLTVPGVGDNCIDLSNDVDPIIGTSDATNNYEQRIFNAVALTYAKEYNFKMKYYLRNQGLFECNS